MTTSIRPCKAARGQLLRLRLALPFGLGVLGLAAFHFLYAGYFFGPRIGEDYSFFLPQLLDGYYWYRVNGLFSIPWFTPSFCGGQPAFPDPQNAWFSVPQWLTLLMPPLHAVYATILLFGAAGFAGMHVLLRGAFRLRIGISAAGALIFLFNGFYAGRMLIGHLPFHGIMLLPWAAYFLCRPLSSRFPAVVAGAATGLVFAYWLHAGMIPLMGPAMLATLAAVALFAASIRPPAHLGARLAATAVVFLGLGAARLTAVALFLRFFPHDQYLLPGMPSLAAEIRVLLRSLFGSFADLQTTVWPLVTHMQVDLHLHEWMYGISALPALLILAWLLYRAVGDRLPRPGSSVGAVVLAAMVAAPVMLNWADEGWQHLLKSLPLLKSMTNMLRWWVVDAFVLLVAALALGNRLPVVRRAHLALVPVAAILVAVQIGGTDMSFFRAQTYAAEPATTAAWRAARQEGFAPRVTQVRFGGNQLVTEVASSLDCYNPVYGYQLEHYPLKQLVPGPVDMRRGNAFNLKNPACYVWPEANRCTPGDHFTLDQATERAALAAFRPFRFDQPPVQWVANGISLGTLAVLIAFLAVAACRRGHARRQRRAPGHAGPNLASSQQEPSASPLKFWK